MPHAKNTKKVTVEPLLLDTYLAVAKGSVGTKMFQKYYARVNPSTRSGQAAKRHEVLGTGNLACAFHVSSILRMFGLVGDLQITVHRLLDDMDRSGWKKIKKPRPGCVVLWAGKPANPKRYLKDAKTHAPIVRHVGIYMGGGKAVSNRSDIGKMHVPYLHPLRYRPIERYYWHSKLSQ